MARITPWFFNVKVFPVPSGWLAGWASDEVAERVISTSVGDVKHDVQVFQSVTVVVQPTGTIIPKASCYLQQFNLRYGFSHLRNTLLRHVEFRRQAVDKLFSSHSHETSFRNCMVLVAHIIPVKAVQHVGSFNSPPWKTPTAGNACGAHAVNIFTPARRT